MKQTTRIWISAGIAAGVSTPAMAQVLYDNGAFQTPDPPAACIPSGSHESLLQNTTQTLSVNGFGVQFAGGAGNVLADDFTVPAPGWHITSLQFTAYMSGNSQTAATPMLGVYVRIWDGVPNASGAHVVFGDLSTNRMTASVFSGAYRHSETACAVTRPLWTNTAAVPLSLGPGTYWVEWSIDGALGTTTGPFAPPVVVIGATGKPGANALQNGTPLVDTGTSTTSSFLQDMPFIVNGTVGAPATGACCLPDGTCQSQTAVACAIATGIYSGDGVNCGSVTCPQPGGCCQTDGTCQLLSSIQCAAIDGAIYRGNGITCAQGNCSVTGACCQLDGTCSLQVEASCKSTNGLFRGLNSSCAFANCPATYNYLGNPVSIPDAVNGTTCGALAFASINVADSFTITSADVSLFATHTYQGDLQFWLQHMTTNTQVRIINQPPAGAGSFGADNYGGSTVPGQMMRLVDSASSYYRIPAAPAGGITNVHWQWKPESPLTAFVHENSAGEWQLQAQDCGPGDVGNIEYWVLAFHKSGPFECFANCDNSTQVPVLNVADFTCFLKAFAAGDPYANCDNSTQVPVLNVADFTCFLKAFAAGCP